MAVLGEYKVPAPFKDEDKWLKFFTKRMLAYFASGLFVGLQGAFFFVRCHLIIIGMVFFVIIMIFAVVMACISMPQEKYLHGGGERMDVLFFRLARKKVLKKNRVLYVKNYADIYEQLGGK